MTIYCVIVTYNGEKWIELCLGSLLRSLIPVEVIVIDNMSSDKTVNEIKEKYPAVTLIESKENLGFGKANNIGIKKALLEGADFVFLLNQDAWIEPDTLQKLVEIQRAHPKYGLLSPTHLNGNKTGLDYKFSTYIVPDECPGFYSDSFLGKQKEVYEGKNANAAAWLLSRQCLLDVGGFDPLFHHYGEDNDYIYRIFYHGYKLGITPFATICHARDNNRKKVTGIRQKIKKNKQEAVLRSVLVLKNINKRYFKLIFKIVIRYALNVLKSFRALKFYMMLAYTVGFIEVIFKLGKINRHRKISKSRGLSFL